MDRVRDRVRNRVRDRDMSRVRDRVRLRGLAIAAPSYMAAPIADPNLQKKPSSFRIGLQRNLAGLFFK